MGRRIVRSDETQISENPTNLDFGVHHANGLFREIVASRLDVVAFVTEFPNSAEFPKSPSNFRRSFQAQMSCQRAGRPTSTP